MDEETGLYYYGARYYNPRESMFLSVDPLAEILPGRSPYEYAFSNPVKLIDPTGMLPEDPEDVTGDPLEDDKKGKKIASVKHKGKTNVNVYNNRGLVNYRSVSGKDTDGVGDAYKSDPTGQSQTSLKGRTGQYPNAGSSDLNPEIDPYTVIPGGAAGKALKKEGVGLGDVAISINLEKMEATTSIVADIGLENKIGENSIKANINMGEKEANHKIGITTPSVVTIIFAGSREHFKNKESTHYTNGKIPTALQVEKLVNQLYRENKANITDIIKGHTMDYFKK